MFVCVFICRLSSRSSSGLYSVSTLLKDDLYPDNTIEVVDMRGEVIMKADDWLAKHKATRGRSNVS